MRIGPRVVAAAAVVGLALGGAALVAAQPSDAPATAVFHVPGQPTGLVSAGDRVWVAGPMSGAVWILDGATGRPAAPAVRTGGTPARLALDARAAWIADTQRGAVVRVPRAGGPPSRPIRVGPDVADIALAAGAVWTASSADGSVRVMEPGRRRPRVLQVGIRLLALAADERRVVAVDAGTGALVRIRASSRRPEGPPVRLGGSPVDVALAGNDAWVADARAGTVQRVDLATGRAGPPMRVGRAPAAVAADAADVYVLCRGDRTLVRIDAARGTIRSRLRLAHEPTALALDSQHVWIAAGEHEVMRVDR